MQQRLTIEKEKAFRDFLIPDFIEVLAYALITLVALGLLNGKRIWAAYNENTALSPESLSESLQGTLGIFGLNRANSFLGDVTVLLFWAAMGSIIYAVIWLTQNSLSGVKSEVVGQRITGDLVKRNYLNSLIAHYMFFIALSIITAASLYVVGFLVLPVVSNAFYGAAINVGDYDMQNIVIGLAAVLFMAFIVHLLNLVLKIYVRFWLIYIRAQ